MERGVEPGEGGNRCRWGEGQEARKRGSGGVLKLQGGKAEGRGGMGVGTNRGQAAWPPHTTCNPTARPCSSGRGCGI